MQSLIFRIKERTDKSMKRIFAALMALTVAVSLIGCEKSGIPEENKGSGIPDNTVSKSESKPITSDDSASGTTSVTQAEEQPKTSEIVTEPPVSDEAHTSQTDDEDDNVVIGDVELKAHEYLNLLNSKKVHAKLTEAVSYDSENIVSFEREYFINQNEKVYINDNQKIVMTQELAYVIDLSEMTYYKYQRDPEDEEREFGYEPSLYSLVSYDKDADGTVTEVYEIDDDGETVKSTWTFSPNGKVVVADLSVEAGSYNRYSFDVIETNISEMDMSIPEGLTEVEPDDYF